MSEAAGEKSFAPSQKRLRDAAGKGDVLRSRELATAAVMLVGAAWLRFAGPWMLTGLEQVSSESLAWDRSAIEHFDPGQMLMQLLRTAMPPVLLLGLAVLGVSLASQLGFGEGRFVAGNLAPKASRLSPLAGFKRMFGLSGWLEMGKGLAKVALLGTIAWVWLQGQLDGLLALGRGTLASDLAQGWAAITALLFALAAGLAAIALLDFPVQWLRRIMRLRMTQQELKDEHKESEGSPDKKAAIRQRQRAVAMGSVSRAMRDAQFVITNPTHFAVAMAYDPALASAPILLAKGRGEKALAMRELAAEFNVPCLEYPALARSVYFTTRERQVIREELYAAVAGVLAFVFSLKRGESPPMPLVHVPAALRFDTEGRPDPQAQV